MTLPLLIAATLLFVAVCHLACVYLDHRATRRRMRDSHVRLAEAGRRNGWLK